MIDCEPKELKVIMNKDFTGVMSIVVGKKETVPSTFSKFSDLKALKENYK